MMIFLIYISQILLFFSNVYYYQILTSYFNVLSEKIRYFMWHIIVYHILYAKQNFMKKFRVFFLLQFRVRPNYFSRRGHLFLCRSHSGDRHSSPAPGGALFLQSFVCALFPLCSRHFQQSSSPVWVLMVARGLQLR